MTRILLHVEPNDERRDEMVALAADLVEAVTAGERRMASSTIGVVADAVDCLEIALVMLGRAAPRTVEGGERRPSPVRLFPFRGEPTRGGERGEASARRDDGARALRELAELGAIDALERNDDGGVFADAQSALSDALLRRWDVVVAAGESERSRVLIDGWRRANADASIVRPPDERELARRRPADMQREAPDPLKPWRDIGVQRAVLFDAVFERIDDERERQR